MQKRQVVKRMHCNSPDHRCPELVVDCSFTKVIACKVGNSVVRAAKARGFSLAKVDKPPPDAATTAGSYIPIFPRGKLREFTLKELGKATGNFSCKRVIGRGGFGTVFRGILSDGTVVAVKVLDIDSGEGLEDFQTEVRASCAIMGISHPNLVPAIGFHSSHKTKEAKGMIVYPFMLNGDVRHYLVDLQPSSLTRLGWTTRKRIALSVARGICILHEIGIVHRDINPSNVLLDENFEAHVTDLGLAKFIDLPGGSCDFEMFHGDEDSDCYTTSRICGTMGYMAPEMYCDGHFSRKSDVYAFGVTLIKIVLGKKATNVSAGCGSESLLKMTEHLFKNKENSTRHTHPGMSGMYDEAIELIRLGLVCVQRDPRKRPLMPEVIAIMEGSSATLKRRWDKYEYTWSDGQMSTDNQSETEWYSRSFCSVEASGSEVGDEEDANEEELEENEDSGNQLQAADDFASEEPNKEHRSGNVQYPHHGYQSGVSCDNSVQPDDASSSVSGVESTSLANSIYLENYTLAEIVQVDQNERGNPKQLSSQANRYEGPSSEVATKLREVLDQMREMELKHQAAIEEMDQKQIAIMQSMIKMQGECIQKVTDMQSQIDQLKGVPQKP